MAQGQSLRGGDSKAPVATVLGKRSSVSRAGMPSGATVAAVAAGAAGAAEADAVGGGGATSATLSGACADTAAEGREGSEISGLQPAIRLTIAKILLPRTISGMLPRSNDVKRAPPVLGADVVRVVEL